MAFISAAWFGHPAEKLKTIGITGTKGKTTTTYMVKSILENAGYKVGLIGTIEAIIGNKIMLNCNPDAKEIRYQWFNYNEVTVFGKNLIPLAPFREMIK